MENLCLKCEVKISCWTVQETDIFISISFGNFLYPSYTSLRCGYCPSSCALSRVWLKSGTETDCRDFTVSVWCDLEAHLPYSSKKILLAVQGIFTRLNGYHHPGQKVRISFISGPCKFFEMDVEIYGSFQILSLQYGFHGLSYY